MKHKTYAICNSSVISDFKYEDGILLIKFQSGSAYVYANVPENVVDELMNADSIGCYFSQFIRNRYNCMKVL